MSTYIGGRIIPKHAGTWDETAEYETLTIVLDEETGDSYISRKAVPAGTALDDEEYWAKSSDYSVQLKNIEDAIDVLEAQVAANVTASTDEDADYAAEVVDARVDSDGDTYDSLGEHIRSLGEKTASQADMEAMVNAFTPVGRNLLDLENPNIVTGYYLDSNGKEMANSSYSISAYMKVVPGKTYCYTKTGGGALEAIYDASFNFLKYFSPGTEVTIPDDGRYVRLSFGATETQIMFYDTDDAPESYEPYVETNEIDARVSSLEDRADALDDAMEEIEESLDSHVDLEAQASTNIPASRNLLDSESPFAQAGYYLTKSGSLSENEKYTVSEYIRVVPGKTYYVDTGSGGAYHCIYDAYFDFLEAVSMGSEFTIPDGGRYVRLSFNGTGLMFYDTDDAPDDYEKYTKTTEIEERLSVVEETAETTWEYASEVENKLDKVMGKNLFNKDSEDIVNPCFLDSDGSERYFNSSYYVSHYIGVEEGSTYSFICPSSSAVYQAVYDETKTLLEVFQGSPVTIPEGGKYVRITGAVSSIDSQQFEEGEESTDYEEYSEYLPVTELDERITELESAVDAIDVSEISGKLDKIYGKNLFNKDTVTEGYYLNASGVLNTNTAYCASDYIAVEEGETYTFSNFGTGGAYHVMFASDKATLVQAISANTDTPQFTGPEGGGYVRMSCRLTQLDSAQFESGEEATDYEEYTEYLPVLENTQRIEELEEALGSSVTSVLSTVLPSRVYLCMGVDLPLYIENILYKSLTDAADIYCTSGSRSERTLTLACDDTGESSFTVNLFKGLTKVSSQSFSAVVTDPEENSGKEMNLLFIGDSYTNRGQTPLEVVNLLEADGAAATLIGTNGRSTYKVEALSGGTLTNVFLTTSAGVARILHVTGVTNAPNTEYTGDIYQDDNGNCWLTRSHVIDSDGNGKIAISRYQATDDDFEDFPESGTLTKVSSSNEGDSTISYDGVDTGYYNPFINHETGELDILYYLEYWGLDTPDVVIFQFTWNDIGTWASPDTLVSNYQTAVDHVHENLPDAKIIISIEPCGSIYSTRDWNGKKYSVLNLTTALCELFEDDTYSGYVRIAPAYACVDLIYGFSTDTVTPSARFPDITEPSSGDGVHPSSVGMCQIADCIYPVITAMTSE